MPDITQKFSIDVTGAISALDTLDAKLANFNSRLDSIGSGLKGFNTTARKAFDLGDAGSQLKLTGDAAAKALENLLRPANQVSTTIPKIGTGANKTNTLLGRLKGVAGGVTSTLKKLDIIGEQAFKGLFGSVGNLTRIIGTRVLIQGFGALQQAVKASVSSAAELSRRIREVGTILPTAQRNSEALTASVRRLSDTFNLPITAVTEGLYQAVSNQIGDAATSLGFLESAAKFAKVAVTDIDTSVNLLSGVINAFGLEARDTESIADQLFKTIELGRTRADELAKSLGRILPVASELGLGLDEVLAGFATITISGIQTSEATTQLRGALNALLKPTEATKELLAELGFTSGEAFIQARGLQGAFVALKEAAGGSITELSKFIPRVRGLNAALIFGNENSDRFQENLRKIREEASGALEQNFRFITEPDPEQVANTLNRLKNLFTVDLGNAILSTLSTLTRFVGGLDTVGAALKTLAPIVILAGGAIGALAAGLFAYNTVAAAATGISEALSISIGTLAGVAATALVPLAIFAAAKFIENNRVAAVNAEIEAVRERNRQELEFEKKQNAAVISLRNARLRELNAVLQEEIAEFNKGFQKRVDIAKKANDEIVADQKRIVNAIVAAGEEITQATKQRISDEESIQKDSASAAADVAQELSDFQFNTENKRFGQLQQFSNLQARANSQAQEAARLARSADSKEEVEAARAAFERAQSTAQSAQSIADQLGNVAAIGQIESTISGILQQKLNSEKRITAASKAREAVERRRLAQQQAELKNIKALAKAVIEAPSLFDDDGEALTGKAQADAIAARQKALTDFRKALVSSKSLSVDQIINFSQLAKDIDKTVSSADIASLNVNSEAFQSVRNQINSNLADFRAEFGATITTLEISQDVKITNTKQLSTAIGDQIKLDQTTGQQEAALREGLTTIKQSAKEAEVALEDLGNNGARVFNKVATGGSIVLGKVFDNQRFNQFNRQLPELATGIAPLIQALRETGTLTEEQVSKFLKLQETATRLNLTTAPAGFQEDATRINDAVTALGQAVDALKQVQGIQSSGLNVNLENNAELSKVLEERAGATADKRREAATAAGEEASAASSSAASNQTAATALNNGALAANSQANALERGAKAAREIQAAQSSSGGATAARMGKFFPRFLADGGFASRGTDTIPAMLSPGEFVVNARSTKRFFSQLQAINAGTRPVFRQDGGPVTNVGDINVTVSGNKDDAKTGRNVANSIRRELRRGTSKL